MLGLINKLLSKNALMGDLIKGSFVPLLAKMGSIGMVYIFTLLVSNYYNEKAVGIFSILFTSLGILSVVAKLGLDTSIVKRIATLLISNKEKEAQETYWFSVILVVVSTSFFSCIVYAFHNELDLFFLDKNYDGLSPFKVLAYALPLFSLLTINAESLRGAGKLTSYSILQNISIFGITIGFIFLWMTPKLDTLEPIQAFIGALALVCLFSFVLYQFKIRPFHFGIISKNEQSSLLKESIPMMLSNSIFFLMTWTDVLMIGYFLPETETGIYHIASKIANLNIVFLFAINSYAAPKIAAFKKTGDKDALKSFAKSTSKLNIILSAPIILITLVFPEFLLGLFGDAAVAGKTVLITLAIGQFINASAGSVINVLNMTGKEVLAQNIILISALINFVLNAILIPIYGIQGAAIASAISIFIWNFLAIIFIYKSYNFITLTFPWQKIS